MTVLPLPARGRWVWDARDRARAVRVSTHDEVGLLNLSVWRDGTCVGTAATALAGRLRRRAG